MSWMVLVMALSVVSHNRKGAVFPAPLRSRLTKNQNYRAASAAVSSRQAGVSLDGRGSERSMNSLCHRS